VVNAWSSPGQRSARFTEGHTALDHREARAELEQLGNEPASGRGRASLPGELEASSRVRVEGDGA
jgi:hypothetical protein